MSKIIISCEHGTINQFQATLIENEQEITIIFGKEKFKIPWHKISCIAHNDRLKAYEIRIDVSKSDFDFYEAVIDYSRGD